ncbi:MAG: hypothetical protein IH851_13640 [Armatimonadetes bacterium]|nr:hypothetical protein [Armatimonadota bacterium]
MVELKVDELPTVLQRTNETGLILPRTEQTAGIRAGFAELNPESPMQYDFRAAITSEYVFTYRMSPDFIRGALFTCTLGLPGTGFGPISSLPPDVRLRVRKHADDWKRQYGGIGPLP